jgi:hypothetical protein
MGEDGRNPFDAVLLVAIEGLTSEEAPTSLGYNDFALIFAQAQAMRGAKGVSAQFISGYLNQHPSVPVDARIPAWTGDTQEAAVIDYLDVLADVKVIDPADHLVRDGTPTYLMHDDITSRLVASVDTLKSEQVPELAIRGMMLYALHHQD